jgi:hypothetical protein
MRMVVNGLGSDLGKHSATVDEFPEYFVLFRITSLRLHTFFRRERSR